jgi:hypothetical protein
VVCNFGAGAMYNGLAAERVTFSARIQLLVSKLGRSSKPSPRFIVVVRMPDASVLNPPFNHT